MSEVVINVFNVVSNGYCVEAGDGQVVYESVKDALLKGKKVIISFKNVEMLTSAFLNTAVGQLYRDFEEGEIQANLSVEDMEQEDMVLLKRVVETAKLYYKNPERMEQSLNEILEED